MDFSFTSHSYKKITLKKKKRPSWFLEFFVIPNWDLKNTYSKSFLFFGRKMLNILMILNDFIFFKQNLFSLFSFLFWGVTDFVRYKVHKKQPTWKALSALSVNNISLLKQRLKSEIRKLDSHWCDLVCFSQRKRKRKNTSKWLILNLKTIKHLWGKLLSSRQISRGKI